MKHEDIPLELHIKSISEDIGAQIEVEIHRLIKCGGIADPANPPLSTVIKVALENVSHRYFLIDKATYNNLKNF